MSNKIIVLKLVSGEEIIARFVQFCNGNNTVEIDKARVIVMAQTGPSQMGIKMIPWVVSAPDTTISVNRSAVISEISEHMISKQLVDGYIQQTTSIQLASGLKG